MPTRESDAPVVTVALVEDDRPYRGYVAALLNSTLGLKVIFEACSVEEALAHGAAHQPRIVFLDIGLPGQSGASSIATILKFWANASVVMLTAQQGDDAVLESIRGGATGFVLKGGPSEAIVDAVNDVLSGGAPMTPSIALRVLALMRSQPAATAPGPVTTFPDLSPREFEIVSLVAAGLSDKEIASRLGTAVSTVKNHLANVYGKWRVRSRTEAAVRFSRDDRRGSR